MSGRPLGVALGAVSALFLAGCSSSTPAPYSTLPASRWTSHPAATASKPTVAAFIGDSYTAGAMGAGARWTQVVAIKEKWVELNLARGGSGYTKAFYGPKALLTCGVPNFCASYVQMGAYAVTQHPDVIVISGGRNDSSSAVGTQAKMLFCQLHSELPHARVIVLSPFWDSTDYPKTLTEMKPILKDAADQCGAQFIDVGSPLAGHPELISKDRVHPNARGYRVLGDAVAAKISAASH